MHKSGIVFCVNGLHYLVCHWASSFSFQRDIEVQAEAICHLNGESELALVTQTEKAWNKAGNKLKVKLL